MSRSNTHHTNRNISSEHGKRLKFLSGVVFLFAGVIVLRQFYLQVIQHRYWTTQAENQQVSVQELHPKRGTIFLQDYETGSLVPAAMSQDLGFVFVVPREFEDAQATAESLIDLLGLKFDVPKISPVDAVPNPIIIEEEVPEAVHIVGTELDHLTAPVVIDEEVTSLVERELTERERFIERLARTDDPYEPIMRDVPEETLARLREADLPGVYYVRQSARLYPESGIGGHVLGFVGRDDNGDAVGHYGIEGYFNETLSGKEGTLVTQKDVAGRFVAVGKREYVPPVNGSDVVLTIDRTIQFMACKSLRQSVLQFQGTGGSVVILDPKTGDVLAMCGFPDFDPATFNQVESVDVYNNPVTFASYEPGSIFKPITMAAGLDLGVVTPSTTFEDPGELKVGPYTIRNSDHVAHGVVTMTQILEQSLNTGVAHVVDLMGNEAFHAYVQAFGFGEKTEIPLETEASGDISSLDKEGDIYAITASFGQGITTTPLQMAQAFSAIANGGRLIQPRLVKEIRHPDEFVETFDVVEERRVMSARSARLLSAMLVSVVENGHGKQAGVKGYYIAGKTGTAQVAERGGYSATKTIGSFAGFGPVEDPQFAMVTRIDNPKDISFAESTAAPLFGDLAEFLLEYLTIPPSR